MDIIKTIGDLKGSNEPSLDSGIIRCIGSFTQPYDFKFHTRCAILDLTKLTSFPPTFYDSASLLGNLRTIYLPNGLGILDGKDLSDWQKTTSEQFLQTPFREINIVSGIVGIYKFVKDRRPIYLVSDYHVNQQGNICDPYKQTQTPITLFGSLLSQKFQSPKSNKVVFLGETHMFQTNFNRLPHSIIGTCKWVDNQFTEPKFKYVHWDIRWEIYTEFSTKLYEADISGDFRDLITQYKNIDTLVNFLYEKLEDAHPYLFDYVRTKTGYGSLVDDWIADTRRQLGSFETFKQNTAKAFFEASSFMTDIYIVLLIVRYETWDIIVYGGIAHTRRLKEFMLQYYRADLRSSKERDDDRLCLNLEGFEWN